MRHCGTEAGSTGGLVDVIGLFMEVTGGGKIVLYCCCCWRECLSLSAIVGTGWWSSFWCQVQMPMRLRYVNTVTVKSAGIIGCGLTVVPLLNRSQFQTNCHTGRRWIRPVDVEFSMLSILINFCVQLYKKLWPCMKYTLSSRNLRQTKHDGFSMAWQVIRGWGVTLILNSWINSLRSFSLLKGRNRCTIVFFA